MSSVKSLRVAPPLPVQYSQGTLSSLCTRKIVKIIVLAHIWLNLSFLKLYLLFLPLLFFKQKLVMIVSKIKPYFDHGLEKKN